MREKTFCKNIKYIDPLLLIDFEEVLPISFIKREALELFRFQERDLINLYKEYKEADQAERQLEITRRIKEITETRKTEEQIKIERERDYSEREILRNLFFQDLDAAIDFGNRLSIQTAEKFGPKNSDLKLVSFSIERPIKHTYSEGDEALKSGYLFSEWLDQYFEDDDSDELVFTLPSGRVANVPNLTAAMVLSALDKATGAALNGEVWALSTFLLDANTLMAYGHAMISAEYENQVKESLARKRANKRHEKTYAIKEFAFQKAGQYSGKKISTLQIAKSIYPEVKEFANSLEQPFGERGFNTVYDWLLKNLPSPT